MAEKLHTRYPVSTLIRASMADKYSNVQMLKTYVKTEIKISKLEKNNLREFRSLFPSTESDALKYENADRVG